MLVIMRGFFMRKLKVTNKPELFLRHLFIHLLASFLTLIRTLTGPNQTIHSELNKGKVCFFSPENSQSCKYKLNSASGLGLGATWARLQHKSLGKRFSDKQIYLQDSHLYFYSIQKQPQEFETKFHRKKRV